MRRAIQTGVAVLFVILPTLNQAGFNFIWGNFLNIHVSSLTFSDPLAVFQVTLKNHYLPIGLLIGAGTVLAISFFLGTVFCSWICPFGLLSELVNHFSSRAWPGKFTNRKIQIREFAVKACGILHNFFGFLVFFQNTHFKSDINAISILQYLPISFYAKIPVPRHLVYGSRFVGGISTPNPFVVSLDLSAVCSYSRCQTAQPLWA